MPDTKHKHSSENTVRDDHARIRRTQARDTEAFSPLVVKYHSRLYTHILGKVKDTETAKDLTQETWLRAYRGFSTFRGDAAFYSWLYRIAENVCIDYFRKQKHEHVIDPLHLIDEKRITDTHPCPSHAVERAELRLILKNAIKCLSTPRKQVFVLYYLHELPIKSIATRLNRSEGTIKSHLRNARLQLQELLTPYLNNQDIPDEC